jgi:hypothetical protein
VDDENAGTDEEADEQEAEGEAEEQEAERKKEESEEGEEGKAEAEMKKHVPCDTSQDETAGARGILRQGQGPGG